MSAGTVIVGGSHAGVQVAASLREMGYDAPVTLLDEQPHQPYHRPPLSKKYLLEGAAAEPQPLRSADWFRNQSVELVLGEPVVSADLTSRTVRTSSAREVGFDHLVLATGAEARRLPVPGGDLPGVLQLRTVADSRDLAARFPAARRAVVIGGGFIGLEAAAVLRQQGLAVTVVEATDRLLGRSATRTLGSHLRAVHEAQGVAFTMGVAAAAIEGGPGGAEAVVLTDGTRLVADLVVVGVGIVPRDRLARDLGLRVEGGIVVDECARTSAEDVLAVGDVTVSPHPLAPGVHMRMESVQHAVDQATAAAATICGLPDRNTPVPWFWSDQYDLKLQLAGAAPRVDSTVLRGDARSGRFSVLLYAEGRLVGGECVNRPADFLALRRALATGTSLPADRVADPQLPLKSLLSA